MITRAYLGFLIFAIGCAFAIIETNIKKKNKPLASKKAVKAKIISQRQIFLLKKAVSFAVEYEDGTSGIEEVLDYQERFKELSLATLQTEESAISKCSTASTNKTSQIFACPQCQRTIHFGEPKCQCGQIFDWSKL